MRKVIIRELMGEYLLDDVERKAYYLEKENSRRLIPGLYEHIADRTWTVEKETPVKEYRTRGRKVK